MTSLVLENVLHEENDGMQVSAVMDQSRPVLGGARRLPNPTLLVGEIFRIDMGWKMPSQFLE